MAWGEIVNKTKDGQLVTVDSSVNPIQDERGNITGFLAIQRDVTQRKLLEEQFRQSQKMEAVGRLAGGVAHDFNNLLTIINGYAQLMLERVADDVTLRTHMGEILKAGNRATALTRQLLAFSRKQVLAPKVLDLNAALEGMQKMLRRLIGEDVELQVHAEEDLGQMKADPTQIEQVLLNLAVNARDAMPRGGVLVLETANADVDETYARSHPDARPGRYVMLSVSDNGDGMDAQTLSHIFEPFYTTKGLGKGSGLGLSTVYGIVRQSGGHVNVYSEVGVGTTFRVYFPRLDEAVSTVDEEVAERPVESGVETILLVEDEPGVRALAERTLQTHGYTVLSVGRPEDASEFCTRHDGTIHLLLTDVIMPGMNGKELWDRLKTECPEIRVLFTSGYTADAIARHGVLDEGVAFLPKPFTPRELLRKVRQTLDA